MPENLKLPGRSKAIERLDESTGKFFRGNTEKAREIGENGSKILRGKKI